MKTLFLLRHAAAAQDNGSGDFNRDLAPEGLAQAKELGRIMRAKDYAPRFVMASPARRARLTAEAALESLPPAKLEFDVKIYEEGREAIMAIIRAFSDEHDAAMLVGHNPSIHIVAAGLAAEEGDFFRDLAAGYPPATLTVLSCPRASWADIGASQNRIQDLIKI